MTKKNNENKNEIVENENTELLEPSIVSENKDYVIVKNEDGKFKRKAKFSEYSSIVAETRKEKIWLLNLLEGAEGSGFGLKDNVGKQIEVQDIITKPYDKINEETGQREFGVLTYLLTPEKIAYVTSSKTVYFTVKRIMDLFGAPDSPEWENVTLQVGKEKGQEGDIIKVKMIG